MVGLIEIIEDARASGIISPERLATLLSMRKEFALTHRYGEHRMLDPFLAELLDMGVIGFEQLPLDGIALFSILKRADPGAAIPYAVSLLEKKEGIDAYFLLDDMLTGFGFRADMPKYTDEKAAKWLPLLAEAFEITKWSEIIIQAGAIEQFFSSFPYESAIPSLLTVLGSDVHATRVIARENIGSGVDYTEHEHGSWQGEYESVSSHPYVIQKVTYETWNPVAEGAKKSLLTILAARPSLEQVLSQHIARYDAIPKPQRVETEKNMTGGGDTTLLYYDRQPK